MSRQESNAFARSLDLRDRYPGLQDIGWRSLVTARLRTAQAEGTCSFGVAQWAAART